MMGELLSAAGQLPDFTQEQWQRVIHFSGDALIVAQVFTTLSANGLFAQLPEDIQAYLQEIYELNSARSDKLISTFTRLAGHLNSVDVYPIALKGISLLVGDKPGEPLRSSRITYDVDVLISTDELLPTLQALQSAGYQQIANPLDKPSGDGTDPLLARIDLVDFRNDPSFARSHVPPVVDDEGACIIELHVAAATLNNSRAAPLTQLIFESSVRHTDDSSGIVYAVPDPVAQLVLAVYHAHIKNGYQFLGLVDWRLLLDMSAVLEAYPEKAIVDDTLKAAQALDMSREMFTAWNLVARYLKIEIDLRAVENTKNLRALRWFYRKSDWRWLAFICEQWVKIKKACALLSARELKQSLGTQMSVSRLFTHLSYRIRRRLNS